MIKAIYLIGPFALIPALVAAQQLKNPMDSIAKLPVARPEHDTIPILTEQRIATLPKSDQMAWRAYIEKSAAQHSRDTASMNRELRSVGRTEMFRAPYSKGFEVESRMNAAWFVTDSARRIADIILTYQAPDGGWSKHVDLTQHLRPPGESYFSETEKWSWISTIDNSATTEQMIFLSLADKAHHNQRYIQSFNRGVGYLLDSQMPNGCWPQVWPLEGGYHDAATFNDDATVNAASLLEDVATGKYPSVSESDRSSAAKAVTATMDCFVRTQKAVNGKLTVWGQQHDPITLEPTSARSYELTSLTAQESSNIMRFLMKQKSPSPAVVNAVHAAAEWLRANQLSGYTYTFDGGLKVAPGQGPIWARMYEIGTNRPIFSDRNAIKLYDWNQLKDRRQGYGWYTYSPVLALSQYDKWAIKHPRSAVSRMSPAKEIRQ